MLELLDQVEDAIGVDNDTVCDKTTHSGNSQDGIADGLPVRANDLVERTKSHIPKEVVGVFSDSSYLVLEVCFWNQVLYHWFFGATKEKFPYAYCYLHFYSRYLKNRNLLLKAHTRCSNAQC